MESSAAPSSREPAPVGTSGSNISRRLGSMNQRKLIVRVFLPLASLLQLFSCFDIMNMCFLSHFYFCSFPQTLVPPPPPPLRLFVSRSRVWVGLFFLLSLWCFYRPQSCLRLSNPIWVFLFSFCLEEIINYHNPLCCLSLIRLCNGVICFTSFCLSSSFFIIYRSLISSLAWKSNI